MTADQRPASASAARLAIEEERRTFTALERAKRENAREAAHSLRLRAVVAEHRRRAEEHAGLLSARRRLEATESAEYGRIADRAREIKEARALSGAAALAKVAAAKAAKGAQVRAEADALRHRELQASGVAPLAEPAVRELAKLMHVALEAMDPDPLKRSWINLFKVRVNGAREREGDRARVPRNVPSRALVTSAPRAVVSRADDVYLATPPSRSHKNSASTPTARA